MATRKAVQYGSGNSDPGATILGLLQKGVVKGVGGAITAAKAAPHAFTSARSNIVHNTPYKYTPPGMVNSAIDSVVKQFQQPAKSTPKPKVSSNNNGLFGLDGGGTGTSWDPNSNSFTNPPPDSIARPNYDTSTQVDPSQYTKTVADFLDQARSMLKSDSQKTISGIDARDSALRSNATGIQGQMSNGYAGLVKGILDQAPSIAQNFQTGISQVGDSAAKAQKVMADSAAAAQSQQQAILGRLGITDANIPIANKGNTLEAQTAGQVADSAARAQSAQTRLSSDQTTALGTNNSTAQSAAMYGQNEQNRISGDLMSQLAALQDQRNVAGQQTSEADAYKLAQDMLSSDQSLWAGNYGRESAMQSGAAQSAFDKYKADLAAQTQEDVANTNAASRNAPKYNEMGAGGQANQSLLNAGVDQGQASIITAAIQQAYETGDISTAAKFMEAVRQASGSDPKNIVAAQNAAGQFYKYYNPSGVSR